MIITCDPCELDFDDTYRRTYCPHEWFEMRTSVYGTLPNGTYGLKGVAKTVEELKELTKS